MYKLPIIAFGIFVVVVVSWFVFIFSTLPSSDSKWPAECDTGLIVYYNDIAKFDKSEITALIRDNFSDKDRTPIGVYKDWWNYVMVMDLDENGASRVGLPGVWDQDGSYYLTLVELLEKIEHISKVEHGGSACA